MKQCNKCNVDLVVGENIPPSRIKNGWYICKTCVVIDNKKHYQIFKNKPDYNDIRKKYRIKHKTSAIKANSILHLSIKAGIYGIFNNCELVYIGESIKPYQRKVNHMSSYAASNCSCIAPRIASGELQRNKLRFKMLEFIDDTEARKQREMCLIQRYKPLYNDLYV